MVDRIRRATECYLPFHGNCCIFFKIGNMDANILIKKEKNLKPVVHASRIGIVLWFIFIVFFFFRRPSRAWWYSVVLWFIYFRSWWYSVVLWFIYSRAWWYSIVLWFIYSRAWWYSIVLWFIYSRAWWYSVVLWFIYSRAWWYSVVLWFIFIVFFFWAGGPLELGDIEECVTTNTLCIKCPYHGWKFDLETGGCFFPGSHGKPAQVYPVKVDEETGDLWVGFRSFSDLYFLKPLE